MRAGPGLGLSGTLSLALHLVLIAATLLASRNYRHLEPRSYTVSLVSPVPAPTPIIEPEPAKTSAPEPAPEPEPPAPKPVPKMPPATSTPAPSGKEYLKDRLESIRAKREAEDYVKKRVGEIENGVTKRERIDEISSRKTAKASSAPAPDAKDPARALGLYAERVRSAIYQAWVFPPDIDIKNLEAVISISIGRDGAISVVRIKRSSGSRLFDRSALKALSKAGSVEPPPAELGLEPIEIVFKPEVK